MAHMGAEITTSTSFQMKNLLWPLTARRLGAGIADILEPEDKDYKNVSACYLLVGFLTAIENAV